MAGSGSGWAASRLTGIYSTRSVCPTVSGQKSGLRGALWSVEHCPSPAHHHQKHHHLFLHYTSGQRKAVAAGKNNSWSVIFLASTDVIPSLNSYDSKVFLKLCTAYRAWRKIRFKHIPKFLPLCSLPLHPTLFPGHSRFETKLMRSAFKFQRFSPMNNAGWLLCLQNYHSKL